MKRVIVAASALLVLSACAVPHQRSSLPVEKAAARTSEVDQVFDRYRTVRNAAIKLLDPKPLSTIESEAVLDIDSGSFEVSQRLAQKQKQDAAAVDVTKVLTPEFSKYPLWFLAVVRDRARGVNRVQVFERAAAADPWLLVASPETVAETSLPELRTNGSKVLTVKPGNRTGMRMSAQEAATEYAKALGDASAPEADGIVNDSFIRQMRSAAAANGGLQGVTFSQAWSAEDVKFVVRTSDGGALAFVTLLRDDTYTVQKGLTVTWPQGTPQQAFLSQGISGSGTLKYKHQVLLHIPGGNGKPRAIGQYGGVVGAVTQ
ncbi:hypothetical protein GCM10022234_02890 [Aeromicrobium panaciterrae]|uniref:lipoprotein n=1 Tax=Aeromicrobium panaciterrae TaxID=363861 RepID=UPI0031D9432B